MESEINIWFDKVDYFYDDNYSFSYGSDSDIDVGMKTLEITIETILEHYNIKINPNIRYNLLYNNILYENVEVKEIFYTEKFKNMVLCYKTRYNKESAEVRKFKIEQLLK